MGSPGYLLPTSPLASPPSGFQEQMVPSAPEGGDLAPQRVVELAQCMAIRPQLLGGTHER